jgi:hypothetical protein
MKLVISVVFVKENTFGSSVDICHSTTLYQHIMLKMTAHQLNLQERC